MTLLHNAKLVITLSSYYNIRQTMSADLNITKNSFILRIFDCNRIVSFNKKGILMEVLVGTDIIEVERIKEAMTDENFKKRVFTQKEIEYCDSKSENIKYQHYAARFAAKEAVFKAISKSLENKYDISWKDIEITNDENSRPIARIVKDVETNEKMKEKKELNKQQNKTIDKIINKNIKIDISISHIKELAVATAVVMLEG